jgi:hypothetical protein
MLFYSQVERNKLFGYKVIIAQEYSNARIKPEPIYEFFSLQQEKGQHKANIIIKKLYAHQFLIALQERRIFNSN